MRKLSISLLLFIPLCQDDASTFLVDQVNFDLGNQLDEIEVFNQDEGLDNYHHDTK